MKLNHDELSKLVTLVKDKDEQAFAKLYELTYQKIYFLCFSMLKNSEDACDAVQDTYLQIYTNIDTLTDNQLFIAWAKKIAYHICLRKLNKKTPDLLSDEQLLTIADEKERANPKLYLEKRSKEELISNHIDQLNPILRTTLIFKYFDNLKVAQIASIMDCPEGTVKSRINTAKRQLKTSLRNDKKGDMLLGAFTFIPFAKALSFSAQHTLMSEQLASTAFQHIMVDSNAVGLSFTPNSTPAQAASSLGSVAVPTAIVAVTALSLMTGTVAMSNPKIVTMMSSDNSFTNEAVIVTATVQTPLGNLKEAYLLSSTGDKIRTSAQDGHTLEFRVEKNGTYTLYVEAFNGKKNSDKIVISTIDREIPQVINYDYTQEQIVFYVKDNLSGINYNSIYGITDSQEKLYPYEVDQSQGKLIFEMPEESFRLYMKDAVGNESIHRIERSINENTD